MFLNEESTKAERLGKEASAIDKTLRVNARTFTAFAYIFESEKIFRENSFENGIEEEDQRSEDINFEWSVWSEKMCALLSWLCT